MAYTPNPGEEDPATSLEEKLQTLRATLSPAEEVVLAGLLGRAPEEPVAAEEQQPPAESSIDSFPTVAPWGTGDAPMPNTHETLQAPAAADGQYPTVASVEPAEGSDAGGSDESYPTAPSIAVSAETPDVPPGAEGY